MACDLSPLFSVLKVLGFILVQTLVVAGQPQVPCYFIFGESIVDNGNNNGLRTTAKANYPPYGIDFEQGASGRFTNGRTYADFIGLALGFPDFIPPYATVTDRQINTGVNYSSGGAGIREESGKNLTLYKLGARKVVVVGLGLIGCTPTERAKFGTGEQPCDDSINNMIDPFNAGLVGYVDYLTNSNPDSRFIFINMTNISQEDVLFPYVPCCLVRGDGQCVPNSLPCPERDSYFFFDGFHQNELLNRVHAGRTYKALSPMDAYPFDIATLFEL